MSSDAVRTDNPQDARPQRPRSGAEQAVLDLLQRLRRSPSWQMALALAFVVIALLGLCRVSGLWVSPRPLPAPTGTSVPLATRTQLPTWTLTNTFVPTPTATMTRTPVPVVMPDAWVVVSGTGAQQLRVRSGPGLTQATLSTVADGTRLRVLDGPESADGYEWWKVQTEDGQEGWVAGEWLSPVAP